MVALRRSGHTTRASQNRCRNRRGSSGDSLRDCSGSCGSNDDGVDVRGNRGLLRRSSNVCVHGRDRDREERKTDGFSFTKDVAIGIGVDGQRRGNVRH